MSDTIAEAVARIDFETTSNDPFLVISRQAWDKNATRGAETETNACVWTLSGDCSFSLTCVENDDVGWYVFRIARMVV